MGLTTAEPYLQQRKMGSLHPDILDIIPETRWYVAIVRNHWERTTKEKLDALNLGLDVYVPTQRVFRIYSDRRKWVESIVIPGVVFVGIREDVSLKNIFEHPIQLRFLKSPGINAYAIVPERDMRRMKDFIARAEEEITLEENRLVKGAKAHIYRGPFQGCEVMVISDGNETKAKIGIELEIMGRTLCTIINKSDLLSEAEWRRAAKHLRNRIQRI